MNPDRAAAPALDVERWFNTDEPIRLAEIPHDHPVIPLRAFERHVPSHHIREHVFDWALERIAEARAARRGEQHRLPRRQRDDRFWLERLAVRGELA